MIVGDNPRAGQQGYAQSDWEMPMDLVSWEELISPQSSDACVLSQSSVRQRLFHVRCWHDGVGTQFQGMLVVKKPPASE